MAINTETFVGISYDEAVSIIKSLGGKVKMLVTNPREEESKKAEGEAKPALQPRREEPPKMKQPTVAVPKKETEPASLRLFLAPNPDGWMVQLSCMVTLIYHMLIKMMILVEKTLLE